MTLDSSVLLLYCCSLDAVAMLALALAPLTSGEGMGEVGEVEEEEGERVAESMAPVLVLVLGAAAVLRMESRMELDGAVMVSWL